ncbi:MAG TPA: PAS domain S-box protein, partial [Bacillota bacterium]|nr:PAS domain S-box protein [Bacillota bacterium]
MKARRCYHSSADLRGEPPSSPALDILALLNLAPVLGRDLQGRIIHWGHGAQSLYGFSCEEALGQVSHHLLHTAFPSPLPELQAQLLAQDYWKGELIHTRKNGSQIVVLSEWVLQRDHQGQPCAILEVNQDITEQKRTAENLRTIFNNVNDGIILHAPDGTVLEVNQRFLTLYGLDFTPEVKLSIADLSSPSAPVGSLPTIWAKVMAGDNQRFQWKARRPKDGAEFEVEVFLTKIQLRETDAILATVRDITRRKHAEQQLRLQSAALQSAANAIVITGRDGLIQWVNPAFTRSTGYSAQEVIGQNPR